MAPHVVYDLTRLTTRFLNDAPNGIDRVDFALARHFLSDRGDASAMVCTAFGPRIAAPAFARRILDETERSWREHGSVEDDACYQTVVARLAGQDKTLGRIVRSRRERPLQAMRMLARHGMHPGRAPGQAVPDGAIYIHASQFLLDRPWYQRWLATRPDVRPVYVVHDLLPGQFPEFFWPGETERHWMRLAAMARLAAGFVVGSDAVGHELQAALRAFGGPEIPVCRSPFSVPTIFGRAGEPDPRVAAVSYFVACGTIEPRKNHLLLLHIWCALEQAGVTPLPKLVLVGKSGWNNENIRDLLDRAPALRETVIEVSGLSTPGLKRLLDGARALLMPSYAEGFGLPVAEALQNGVPVIASDIPVLRETAPSATLLDPIDGLAWLAAIRRLAEAPRRPVTHPPRAPSWAAFEAIIDAFFETLETRPPATDLRPGTPGFVTPRVPKAS